MKALQVALVVAYLFMAPFYFTSWLKLFHRSAILSSNERFASLVVLIISTILWPLVVPIAYLELLKQKTNELDQGVNTNSEINL